MPSISSLFHPYDIYITYTLVNNRYSYTHIAKLPLKSLSSAFISLSGSSAGQRAGYGFSHTAYIGVCLQIHLPSWPSWPCPQ